MTTGVVTLNFGEPEEATEEAVVPFLERIFRANASLEGDASPEEVEERSRKLARDRAPALAGDYEKIGGSPLNRQAKWQAEALASELGDRGHDARTYPGFQFTEPFVADAVARARNDGVELLVGLPVYPLCGRSTTMDALRRVRDAIDDLEWTVPLREITGWHRHPDYVPLQADTIRDYVHEHDVDLYEEGTAVLFSVHGTPMKYVKDGPRYVKYAEELARRIARELGLGDDYRIGYQNHRNRPIEWTAPDIEDVVDELDAKRVVVAALSFMHEQSETLVELDLDLRERAEGRELEFHRIPVPHRSRRFVRILADLAEPLLAEVPAFNELQLKRCLCRTTPYTFCLNAGG